MESSLEPTQEEYLRLKYVCRSCGAGLSIRQSSDVLGDDVWALRERIRELEKLLGQYLRMPRVFKLSATEEQIALALYTRTEVSSKGLWEIVYGHLPECDQPEPKVIDVMISHLRKKISIEPYFLVIETVWGLGYRMTMGTKITLRRMMPEENEQLPNGVGRTTSAAASV